MTDETARDRMVTEQIERRGILAPAVLRAFRAVPRHQFIPLELRSQAYEDHPVEIGLGQTISQPYMVATMVDALAAPAGSRVLEIGTGSGYQTAILCEMGLDVFTIERHAALAENARKQLESLGYRAQYHVGDGTIGWRDHAPYRGIVVSAGAPDLPIPLVSQLDEGGRLVIPVGTETEQELIVAERAAGRVTRRRVCACRFVKLVGEHGWPNSG